MSELSREERIARLLSALEQDTEVVTAPVERAWSEIPTYTAVTREQIEAATTRNRDMAVEVLRRGQAPALDRTGHVQQATLERLRLGVPIEDAMAGFRLSISAIEDRLIELSKDFAVPGEDVVPMIRLLSQFSDVLSAAGATAYREHGLALAVTERRRRDEWLTALLAGTLGDDRLGEGSARYRIDREARHLALCGAEADDATNDRAVRTITSSFDGVPGVLVHAHHGRLEGVLPAPPPVVTGLLLATGPAVVLDDIASSFATARRVLAASSGVAGGVQTVDDLGWRLAVPFVPEVADHVRRRYLDPLEALGPIGDVVMDDLRAYLDHARSIPRAAKALHVHVNTLRYRLARFEEVTGRSLADTDTLVELSWALELRTARS